MIYLTPDNGNIVKDRDQSKWGQLITPASFIDAPRIRRWAGDNEVFTGRYSFRRFYRWLWRKRPYRQSCLFIAAPDVVGSARLTLLRYPLHYVLIKALGFPVAFVGQDGLEKMNFVQRRLPYDALFIGGSTEWKMSPASDDCIRWAKRRGKWIHVGRVNSLRRMIHFKLVGVNSVDGTKPTYEPDRVFRRFQKVLLQPALFELLEED